MLGRIRISIALTSILALAALLLTGCGGDREGDREKVTDPNKLAPAGSNLIASVKLARILEDPDFKALYAEVPTEADDPQTLDELLGRVTEEIGVDLRQISEVVLFGDVSRFEEYFALVARGSFEEEKLVAAIERAGEASLRPREYKGYRIHVDDDDDAVLSVLGSDTLVLGTLSAVQSVIDVQKGDEAGASGKMYDDFKSLRKDALLRLAVEVPPEALQGLEQEEQLFGDLPISLEAFKDISTVVAVLDKERETMKVEVKLNFTRESSAKDVGDTIDGLLKLVRGLAPNEETKRLLDKVKVSSDKARVTVLFEATVSELKEVVGSLEDGFPGLFSRGEWREAAPLIPAPGTGVIPGIGKPVPIMDSRDHIPVGETATYSTTPPTSGPHWPRPASCGIYDEELPDELIVHNLEHGNVVISYNLPDPQEARRLREVVEDLPGMRIWGIVRPYSQIEEGTVAMTAWGVIDLVKGVDEVRIRTFFDTYRGYGGAPELIPCVN